MAVNKVVRSDGTTLIDLTGDTVTHASHIISGRIGHLADGTQVTGTGQGSGTTVITVNDTADSGGGTIRTITAVDISDTTAVASDVAQGKYFYNASGVKTAGTASGGPSVTKHTIHFEFSDETDADVDVYYDDANISSVIATSKPTTYNSKTVESAELDGVQWYIRETWETVYDDTPNAINDPVYAYFWLSSLADLYPTVGSVWRVTFDGVEYRCVATMGDTIQAPIVGAYDGVTDEAWTNPIPFRFYNGGWGAWLGDTTEGAGPHTLKIERLVV